MNTVQDTQAPVESRLWTGLALAATLIGVVVRLVHLDTQSLWLDEWLEVKLASKTAWSILETADGEAPLYGLLLHAVMRLGGTSEWWVRLPSAVAGAVAIPLLYAIGRRLVGPRTSAVAAVLFAIHPFAVWYAQEARAYAVLALLALVATWCMLELQRTRAQLWGFAYAVSACLGLGVHYYFVFVGAAHALFALVDWRGHPERRAAWTRTAVVTVGLCAIWVPCLRADVAAQAGIDRGTHFSWFSVPYTVLVFVGGLSFGPPLRDLHPTTRGVGGGLWIALRPHIGVTLAALGTGCTVAVLPLVRRLCRRDVELLFFAVLPVLGPWIASAMVVGYRPRYVLPALPFVLLWAASGLRGRFSHFAAVSLVVLGGFEINGLMQMTRPEYAREDTRSAAAWVATRSRGGTAFLLGETSLPFERYANGLRAVRALWPYEFDSRLGERLAGDLAASEDVFLVSSRPWTVDPEGMLQRVLDAQMRLREEAHFAGVDVRWYTSLRTSK
jgi:hypothetical protein